MPIEDAKYIQDLKPNYPTNLESFSTTDDHIIVIKNVLKNTFKNITSPVTITGEDLNFMFDFFKWNSISSVMEIGVLQVIPPIPTYIVYEVKFLGYISSTDLENQYAILDKDTKLVKKMPGLGALGSVIWSILPLATMTQLYGNCYALCDGTDIQGSEIHRETGIKCTPTMMNGEAIIMEAATAGSEQYTNIVDGTFPTKFNKKPFNTHWKDITGTTNTVSHNHGGGLHKHQLVGLYNSSIPGGAAAADEYLNLSFGPTVVPITTPREFYADPFTDIHKHTFTIQNLNPETTPPAIYMYCYMRIN